MGLFGGGNKKTYTTNNLTDARQQVSLNQLGGPAVVTKGNVNLTYIDQGAVQGGLAVANNAVTAALDHGNTVAKTAFQFGSQALNFGNNALAMTDKSAERAFNFATDVQRQADESQRDALSAIESTGKTALSYVDAANRSDLSRNFDNLIKWGGLVTVALAAVYFLKG
ncbi:MAG TPA: hypothetical protein VFL97_05165 [Nitrococcus sp.]|nr:hypothetical protein [Nitrococcus sp.]